MASDSCDNKSRRYVTNVTDLRRAITEQRYNSFSSDSIRICSHFEKVHPRLVEQIEFLGLETG